MKFSISVTGIVALATSAIASPIGLNIPGIINLDIGTDNGLSLNVLGGLIHANVGGRSPKALKIPMAAPVHAAPAVPAIPAVPAVPAVPAIPAFSHFF
ncbi:hypothetical protein IWW37_003548 [Coemansia sp. RSA 2050]|nr:hypothetical protein IWW37_003548 [Coemansia sp. RSA 2050]KAJ2732957.1 hypothetical protein IW152_003451 [Coemansia sp. BCRC 34962]